mgnify:CR=1 FL=1
MKPLTKGISVPILTETPLPDTFSQSQSVACKIGTVAPDAVFCTFALQGSKKIPYKRSGQGVARDTDPTDLYSAEDIWAMEAPAHGQYLGLVQQRPIISASGNYLVCLDVDMKHAKWTNQCGHPAHGQVRQNQQDADRGLCLRSWPSCLLMGLTTQRS